MSEVDNPSVVDRVSCGLVRDAATALDKLMADTGLKKADVVNRALQVYAFVDAEIRAGNTLMFRTPEGELQKVRIV